MLLGEIVENIYSIYIVLTLSRYWSLRILINLYINILGFKMRLLSNYCWSCQSENSCKFSSWNRSMNQIKHPVKVPRNSYCYLVFLLKMLKTWPLLTSQCGMMKRTRLSTCWYQMTCKGSWSLLHYFLSYLFNMGACGRPEHGKAQQGQIKPVYLQMHLGI